MDHAKTSDLIGSRHGSNDDCHSSRTVIIFYPSILINYGFREHSGSKHVSEKTRSVIVVSMTPFLFFVRNFSEHDEKN
jgi:hypothetical protein